MYDYETRTALLISKHKLDALTGLPLAPNQHVFRKYDYTTLQTSYFYRTNEKLVGKCAKPVLIKKNYRLGTRTLNPLSLLNLAHKSNKKELYLFKKPQKPPIQNDFQEFLITNLLLLCEKAQFLHTPLEQDHVPKELDQCNQSITNHFQPKPVLHFSFLPENASVVRAFIDQLDQYATEFDMEESKDFTTYPISHDQKHETIAKLGGVCP